MVTALVILLLLTLCGFIAYMGDLLGRRLGKKRLSVFGLRPKHTAILLTVVTGVLIAGFTFGAALIIVPGFRQAVIHSERLMRQNRDLARENAEQQQANVRLVRTNGQLVTENQTLAGSNKSLVEQNRKLAGQNEKLQKESTRLAGVNTQLKAANTQLSAGNQRLTGENQRLIADRNRLANERTRLSEETTALRLREYVFRKDELLDRRPFPPNPPAEVVADEFRNLLLSAEEQALKRNLAPHAGAPAVTLVPPRGSGLRAADSKSVRSWLIKRTRQFRGRPVAIWAVVDKNCVRGQALQVRIECFANDVVFRKGEEVAHTQVDGADTPGVILMKFIGFLQSTVRDEATRPPRSMIATEEQGLGEMNPDAVLDICNRIREVGGPAVIFARARTDTRRAGPLNLEFEVRPASAVLPKSTGLQVPWTRRAGGQ